MIKNELKEVVVSLSLTESQKDFVMDNYSHLPIPMMAETIGTTYGKVENFLNKMGLIPTKYRRTKLNKRVKTGFFDVDAYIKTTAYN